MQPAWLQTKTILSAFGGKQRRKHYRTYMKDGVDDETRAFYGAKHTAPVIGGAAFREKIREQLEAYQSDRQRVALKWLRERPSIKRIVKTTAEAFDVGPESIYVSRRGRGSRNIPRLVAMSLCRSPGGHSLIDIARAFGIGHYASVSVAANRLKGLAGEDDALAKQIEKVRGRLESKEKREKDKGKSKKKKKRQGSNRGHGKGKKDG